MSKVYDITIIGANGFVGKRFVEEIASTINENHLNWCLTARSQKKLDPFKNKYPKANFEVLDLGQEQQVEDLVKRSKIVVNLAGPFDLYGENVVAPCAKYGTHYFDITGEANFVHRIVKKYHKEARYHGAVIVPCAGFDSVPSDVGSIIAAQTYEKEFGKKVDSIDVIFKAIGGFNGGTVASAIDLKSKMNEHDIINRQYLAENAEDKMEPHDKIFSPRYIKEEKIWVAPFFMETINGKIIYRTKSLLDYHENPYSNKFNYRESMYTSDKFSRVSSSIGALVLNSFDKVLNHSWGRQTFKVIAPNPGQGPSEDKINKGFFQAKYICRSTGGQSLSFTMKSSGDPGNKSTVKLLKACVEAAIKRDLFREGGVLTPATAFGAKLLPYLKNNAISWQQEQK